MPLSALDIGSTMVLADASDVTLISKPLIDQGGTVFGLQDQMTFIDVADADYTAAGFIAWAIFKDSLGSEQERFPCNNSGDPDTLFLEGNSSEVGVGMSSRTSRMYVGFQTAAKIVGVGSVS